MSDLTSPNASPGDAAPIEEALSGLAELADCDLGLAKRFAARIEACGDDEDEKANSLARSYQRMARSYRQTLAMTLRMRRELKAEDKQDRLDADAQRKDAERARDVAVRVHHMRVRRHFERALWDEYEEDDAQEIFNDLDDRLAEFAGEAGFLETPAETLIARLTEEFGVGVYEDEVEGRAASDSTAESAECAEEPSAVSASSAKSLRPLRLNPAAPDPIAAPPEPDPPPRPPDPPPELPPAPEPYIPPWEQLRPGQRFPGGSGW